MTDEQIIAYYDEHMNLTIGELAGIVGKSTVYLKKLLQGE